MTRLSRPFGRFLAVGSLVAVGSLALASTPAPPPDTAASGGIAVVVQLGAAPATAPATGALVWVAGFPATGGSAAAPPIAWSTGKVAPAATAVRAPGHVTFANHDTIAHELFSGAPAVAFTHDLTAKGAQATLALTAPGPVPIYCNDHPREVAELVATDGDPRATDAAGTATFSGVQPGHHSVRVWLPGGSVVNREVEVEVGKVTRIELAMESPDPRRPHPSKGGQPYPKGPGAIEARVTRVEDGIEVPAAGAVAWLVGSPTPSRPGHRVTRGADPAVAARDKKFEPRVEVVSVGRKVEFPNYDRIFHNVFSLSETKAFDLGLYKNGKSVGVDFDRPGVVKVYCNIHPKMVAFVLVIDGENHARVGEAGVARLEGVPPGSWTLKVWDERGGEWSGAVEVKSGSTAAVSASLTAGGDRSDKHKNKHGEEYANPDDEDSRY